jgi:hypothetical protein
MNNVSTTQSGAVSCKNLAGAIIAGKQFIEGKISDVDNFLIIKITRG